jgi:hypothetical protein
MSKDKEREQADKMYDDGHRDAVHDGKPNCSSDRTYGNYVRDYAEYTKGYEAGESAKKSK